MSKKNTLSKEICKEVTKAINDAEAKGSLNYFELSISNHEGIIDTKLTTKSRKRVYK